VATSRFSGLGRSQFLKEWTMAEEAESRAVELDIDGKKRVFDIDDPKLPDWIDKKAFSSDDYPYDKKFDGDEYEETLEALQVELVKVQFWQQKTGKRIMAVFEGRDAAGKGGAIQAPDVLHEPALRARRGADKADRDRKARPMVFPALCRDLPDHRGEFVNVRPLLVQPRRRRAGHGLLHAGTVRKVPRRSTPRLREDDHLGDGIHSLQVLASNIGREMQLKRFHDRRHDPVQDAGNSRRWTSPRSTSGTTIRKSATAC
jgi:hypothetical protein